MKQTIDYAFTLPFTRQYHHGPQLVGTFRIAAQFQRNPLDDISDPDSYSVHFDSVHLIHADQTESDILPFLRFTEELGNFSDMWDYLQDYCKGLCAAKWREMCGEAVEAHYSTRDMPLSGRDYYNENDQYADA